MPIELTIFATMSVVAVLLLLAGPSLKRRRLAQSVGDMETLGLFTPEEPLDHELRGVAEALIMDAALRSLGGVVWVTEIWADVSRPPTRFVARAVIEGVERAPMGTRTVIAVHAPQGRGANSGRGLRLRPPWLAHVEPGDVRGVMALRRWIASVESARG